jgi:transposase InsO family protein
MVASFIHAVRLLIVLATGHRTLVLENLALRQQLAVYRRTRPKPAIRWSDRLFWTGLRWAWPDWKSALVVVRPATVVAWHRRGFAWYWARRSRRNGRPPVGVDVRRLVREMAAMNPLWGAPRIHGELLKLGFAVSERTVSRLMPRRRKPPSQTWRTFLENHLGSTVAVDFFAVPTVTCRILFVFIVLAHDRRRIVHVDVTPHPTSAWTRQQLREAFPNQANARFLLHDGDTTFDAAFGRSVEAFGLTSVRTAPRSPWQNPYVERVIGSIRRECLDHVIALNQRHLRRVLRAYIAYYQRSRTHLALGKDAPEARAVEPTGAGRIVVRPAVGGLHHRYARQAA